MMTNENGEIPEPGKDEFVCPMCHLVQHKSRCGSFGRWVVCHECLEEM